MPKLVHNTLVGYIEIRR